MTKEVEEYFNEQYAKEEFSVMPGHWPDFESKEHVDRWIKLMRSLGEIK